MLLVIGVVILGAASKAPLESLFVLGTLSLGAEALGLVGGSWGLGMVLGSVAAPLLARRWPRERLFAACIAVVGLSILTASRATELTTVLIAWLAAGAANAVGNVSYDSLLQERTPDELRGRVFAASEAVINAAFLSGALIAGWVGSHLGVRAAYAISGGVILVAAVLARILLSDPRRPGEHPPGERHEVTDRGRMVAVLEVVPAGPPA
jgi:MFS family permease